MARTVLFLQHASALGGSSVSLRLTVQHLDPRRWRSLVALTQPSPSVEQYYARHGIPTLRWPGITSLNHTTALQGALTKLRALGRAACIPFSWRQSARQTLALLEHVRPDLVHLNSVVLAPAAPALTRCGQPFVWHVREHPPEVTLSPTTGCLRQMLIRHGSELIFLSEADRSAWVRSRRGIVVPNFVDSAAFDPARNGGQVRAQLGIPQNAPTLLYAGGLSLLKGIEPLLEALRIVRRQIPALRCIAPGCVYPPPSKPLVKAAYAILPKLGSGTTVQRAEQFVLRHSLGDCLVRLPFAEDMAELIAAADIVVFPAIGAHFARPVIEGAMMAKPVVASRLHGMDELVRDGVTGLLVEPGDARELAAALCRLLSSPSEAREMGQHALAFGRERFDAARGCAAITAIYEGILDGRGRDVGSN